MWLGLVILFALLGQSTASHLEKFAMGAVKFYHAAHSPTLKI